MMLLILEVKYLIKVSDTRRADFTEECRRQARFAAQADLADVDVMNFMDDVLVAEDGEDEGECYNFPSFHAKVNQTVKFSFTDLSAVTVFSNCGLQPRFNR